tara:strand:- start:2847 stop:3665 length:819 start_codon:yes stop_codon:yes gene_type:complete
MKKYNLKSSEKPFEAITPPSECYIELDDLLSSRPMNNLEGFLVVKNVFSPDIINSLRSEYFSRFKEDYEYDGSEWTHVKRSKLSHGVGIHPANAFVRSKSFCDFIESKVLKKLAALLLNSDKAVLCPRAITRSFSHLSSVRTLAHRDRDYFRTTDNSKALTAWIPLGPTDIHYGQLVYLKDSQQNISKISQLAKDKKTITSDLQGLADHFKTTWHIPTLSKGDVVFHCLNNVHASFDTHNIVPRLSCDLRFASSSEYLDPRWSNYWRGNDGL